MKITQCNIVQVSLTKSLVDLIISDPASTPETTELLHIRIHTVTHANPLVSEVRIKALRNARDVIASQIQEQEHLPPHPEHE